MDPMIVYTVGGYAALVYVVYMVIIKVTDGVWREPISYLLKYYF